jgi:hypothetical protein
VLARDRVQLQLVDDLDGHLPFREETSQID